jgi:predicted RND superfamily exporter protein
MRAMQRTFQGLVDHPFVVLVVVCALVVLVGRFAPDLKFDASADALTLEGDRSLDYAREIGERYTSEDFLLVTYEPDADLFSDEVLQRLAALRDELAALDSVSSVVSILDVPLLYSPQVSLGNLGKTLPRLSDGQVDRSLAAQEFLHSPIYEGLLTNADNSVTALQVNLQRDETYFRLLTQREDLRAQSRERQLDAQQRRALAQAEQALKDYRLEVNARQEKIVADMREVLAGYRDHARIFLGGVPMIAVDLIAFVKSDMRVFGIGILLFIVVLLAVIFHALRWVLIPLLICGSTTLGMVGGLVWFDWRLTVISSNFVAILLIINLSIVVHLVVRYRELAADGQSTQRELVLQTLESMARPCFYTTLTTLVAFATLVVSDIRPVIDFGWMMAMGVSVALVNSFVLFGACSMLLPRMHVPPKARHRPFTRYFAVLTERFGRLILLGSLVLAGISIWGVSQLEVENRFIDNFFDTTEIYQGMETIDRELGGTIPLQVIIDADPDALAARAASEVYDEDDPFADEGDTESSSLWFSRSGLDKVTRAHRYLDSLPETGKVMSLANVYQVTKDLAGEDVDDVELAVTKSGLPDDIKAVLIDPYLSDEQDQARIVLRVMETQPDLRRNELLQRIERDMVEKLGFEEGQVKLTGMLVLYNNMLQSLFRSQILSLSTVFLAILAMFLFLFRSLKLALLAMVPNVLGAAAILGIMGITGIPLDMMTITVAAICIGIGVDDTIHYLHRYGGEFGKDRDYIATMYRCHSSIGRAMYYTSVIIIFGFAILMLSNFRPSIYFGILTGGAMVAALLGNLLLLPALLLAFKPYGRSDSMPAS